MELIRQINVALGDFLSYNIINVPHHHHTIYINNFNENSNFDQTGRPRLSRAGVGGEAMRRARGPGLDTGCINHKHRGEGLELQVSSHRTPGHKQTNNILPFHHVL